MLGIGAVGDDAYQFTNGDYYVLERDGIKVSSGSENNWNIRWIAGTGDEPSILYLKNAAIKTTLYIPSNSKIKTEGTCSIEGKGAGIQVRTSNGGDLTIDVSGSFSVTSDIDAIFNTGDGNNGTGGSIRITGAAGSTFSCADAMGATNDIVFDGAIKVEVKSDRSSALWAHEGDIVLSEKAELRTDGDVDAGTNVLIDGESHLSLISTRGASISDGYRGSVTVQKGASIDIDTAGTGIVSFTGSVSIAGKATIKAGPGSSAISRGGSPDDFSYCGEGAVTVTGELSVTRARNAIQQAYGDVVISDGGKLNVSGVTKACVFPCGGKLVVDDGTVKVDDSQVGVAALMLASDKVNPSGIVAKNGSSVTMNTTSYCFDDQSGEGKPPLTIELSNSSVSLSSGAGALANPVRAINLSYTKDFNADAGQNADAANRVDAAGITSAQGYLSIKPVAADWTQTAHEWADAWSSSDSHHWHVCESSVCSLGDDITKMDGYAEHVFGKYVSNGDATCLKDGTETAMCACGYKVTCTDEGSALGHRYENGACVVCGAVDPGYDADDPKDDDGSKKDDAGKDDVVQKDSDTQKDDAAQQDSTRELPQTEDNSAVSDLLAAAGLALIALGVLYRNKRAA